ncbi:hypothetical protein Clacol_001367 [Clathrus columnatus]|uniref:Ubiquitin carboxyl-terminal hydrolase n=1 Tax=Clathrus columnatus TaxID=1419009 RepID=A0AAV5A173_9AGAM|nr:hypothetical protein Clacol_001367 [Clathrus columnatus]
MLAVQSSISSSPFTTTAVAAERDPPTPSSAVVAAQQAQENAENIKPLQSQQQSILSRPFTHSLARSSGLDAILKDKVEFVEGSSTGLLSAGAESKYPYINVPNTSSEERSSPNSKTTPTPGGSLSSNSTAQRQVILYDRPFNMVWAMPHSVNGGFINTGNTCFLNSVLQCLVHTTPLQHILKQHGSNTDKCRIVEGFCMACKLRDIMENSFRRGKAFIPTGMVNNLQRIAKTMRRGRQEDAHEFLRYSIDALQRSCLAGFPPKLDPKIAETSWVHKLFGGRLRSRVTCTACDHVSDTFDTILDLSIDIQGVSSVSQALSKFVAVDYLRGANKYNCERCKKPVNADKRFTIHDAPACLTVHLKRFTPLGRKIGHPVDYSHVLDLSGAMSEGQHPPSYALYGVISHAGGGPNSGHYYAHVKGANGTWYEANDESVTPISASSVVGRKNAYILFYARAPGDSLNAALKNSALKKRDLPAMLSKPLVTPKPFIGPVLPPVFPSKTAPSLVPAYEESDSSEDKGEPVSLRESPAVADGDKTTSLLKKTIDTRPQTIEGASASISNLLTPIPPSSFYGDSGSKKRKGWADDEDPFDTDIVEGSISKRQRSESPRSSSTVVSKPNPTPALLTSNNSLFKTPPIVGNPFNRSIMGNNLNEPSRTQKIAIVGVGLTKKMKKKPHGLM